MTTNFWDRFPSKLKSPIEAPDPLRGALLQAFKPDDSVQLMIFGPASKTPGRRSAATVLAILDSEWIFASAGAETDMPVVTRCRFSDTLMATFTTILLCGRLEIDFAAEGGAQHVLMEFNTVMDHLYRQALQLLLDGVDGTSPTPAVDDQHSRDLLKPLMLRLQNAVGQAVPRGQSVQALVHWPAVFNDRRGLFRRELSPAAALVLTNREIILVSDEKAGTWFQPDKIDKYGSIATYIPLSRLRCFGTSVHDRLDTLDLDVGVEHGYAKVKVEFPRGLESELLAFVEQARHQPTND